MCCCNGGTKAAAPTEHADKARSSSGCWNLVFLCTDHLVRVRPPTTEQIRIKNLMLRSKAEMRGNGMCIYVESY